MKSRIRVILYAMMIVLIALASAFSVVPARADDGAPPPPAAPAAPAAHSQAPAGADVAVVNSDGHKVSLASQEAAGIVASGDPIWCPTGVAPKPGLGGCTFTQLTFNGGLLPLIVNEPKNGTIWIESGYDSSLEGGPVVLNGTLGTTINHSLTITGGWNGLSNGKLNPLHPYSTFNNVALIINWNGPVTLNNLTISNVTSTIINPSGNGLTVTTPGTIVLNNIDAFSNAGWGAALDNCISGSGNCIGKGTVSVNYSTFSHNGDVGLKVASARTIAGKNLTAVENTGPGVYLNNWIDGCTTCTPQPVTLTGINTFSFNGASSSDNGLDVFSRGAITVGNVTAINNTSEGVYLDNCGNNGGTGVCNNATLINGITHVAYNITMRGTNNTSDNGDNGLEIWSTGAITVTNLTSNNNGQIGHGFGARLSNFGAILTKKYITVNGINFMSNNGSSGLWLDSRGIVTVASVTANYNGLLDSCTGGETCDGLHLHDSAGFIIAGFGTFNNNKDYGLQVNSTTGAVTIANLYVYGNAGFGAYIDNCAGSFIACSGHGNVTLSGRNVINYNGKTGLSILSYGVVTLSNVTSSYNGQAHGLSGSGTFVETCLFDGVGCIASTPRAVTLAGVNNFNSNYVNGLTVFTQGPITATSLTVMDNQTGYGTWLKNQWGVPAKYYNITLKGFNNFSDNLGGDGLKAEASGLFNGTDVTAFNNTSGNGLTVNAILSITLTCGALYSNSGMDLSLTSQFFKTISLKGVYLDPLGTHFYSNLPVVTRACPLP